jgi:hypothetical protein
MRIKRKNDHHQAYENDDFYQEKNKLNDQHHHQLNNILDNLLKVNHPELFDII